MYLRPLLAWFFPDQNKGLTHQLPPERMATWSLQCLVPYLGPSVPVQGVLPCLSLHCIALPYMSIDLDASDPDNGTGLVVASLQYMHACVPCLD